jgi:hypothetical protein
LSDGIAILLLCEVAVKPWAEMNDANYDAGEVVKKGKKLYAPFNPSLATAVTLFKGNKRCGSNPASSVARRGDCVGQ